MDDETGEMEKLTQQMRAIMAAWVAEPGSRALRQQYHDLQHQYQRLFLAHKQGQRGNGVA